MTDEVIAELAHELKTPLTGVLAAIDLVTDAPVPLDETEIAELLAVARSEAYHLQSIIDGIVQRARLDAGTLEAEHDPVAVIGLVETTLARFPTVSDRTAITGDTSLVADTDHSIAAQILTNLFQNIARYAPTGPVSVTLSGDESTVRILVADHGPGLPGGSLPSSKGLGVGLSTSRRLAEFLGGSLEAVPADTGATFRLALPSSETPVPAEAQMVGPSAAPPRARLLQEVTDLLVGTSLDRILTGVGRLGREMLGASTVRVFERRADEIAWLIGEDETRTFPEDETIRGLFDRDNGAVTTLAGAPFWLPDVGDPDLAAVTMRSVEGLEGLLVVGWRHGYRPPFADGVAPALAALALVGMDRRSVGAELDFERRVRASVMDSLPLAISVFAGDPPRLIDVNRAELALLGIDDDTHRPDLLTESQKVFDVRFEDGTPLDGENAPVVETIRHGRSTGPFALRIRRADGTEVVTRTYCAPVRDGQGAVIGAVVTSEEIDD